MFLAVCLWVSAAPFVCLVLAWLLWCVDGTRGVAWVASVLMGLHVGHCGACLPLVCLAVCLWVSLASCVLAWLLRGAAGDLGAVLCIGVLVCPQNETL